MSIGEQSETELASGVFKPRFFDERESDLKDHSFIVTNPTLARFLSNFLKQIVFIYIDDTSEE